tara:strand:+ start:228 stop:1493 length:1266 start_codon:yes stop_codon:yes gene_type:complete
MNWKGRKMFSSAVDMQSGGSVPYPSYQMGGAIPAPLFEEGDDEINMALNTMASMTSPSVKDINQMETEPMGAMGEMTKDQGPMDFNTDLMELKNEYKNEIFSFVEKPGAIEKLAPYLKSMQLSYQNDLTEIMKKHGVVEPSPEQELFTPEFVEEIKMAFDSGGIQEMRTGGVALPTTEEDLQNIFQGSGINITLDEFNRLNDTAKQEFIKIAILQKATQPNATTQSPYSAEEVKTRLGEIIEERKRLARQSVAVPLTKQGGFGGFVEQVNALRAGQAAAESQALAEEADLLRLLAGGTGVGGVSLTADQQNRMTRTEEADPRTLTQLTKAAAETAEGMMLEPTVHIQHAIIREDSPFGFAKFPQYSGGRVVGTQVYTVEEYIAEKLNDKKQADSEFNPSDPNQRIQAIAEALREWTTLTKI